MCELTMTKIKQISLWRAEGRSEECYPIIFVNKDVEGNEVEYEGRWKNATLVEERLVSDIESEVQAFLFKWGKTAPKNGGYDKTDFRVTWDNGFSYEGRFDMEYGGLDAGQTFIKSLKGRMDYYKDMEYPKWASYSKEEHEEWQRNMKETLADWQ
tara:strand:+ start:433 stop:897 length:465 start_codon:yes stop_codon:yes gene_type:complete